MKMSTNKLSRNTVEPCFNNVPAWVLPLSHSSQENSL